jgi:signal transduction histidine kinase
MVGVLRKTATKRKKGTKRVRGAANARPRRSSVGGAGVETKGGGSGRARRAAEAPPPSATALAADCERLEELCRALEVRAEVAERSHRETVSTISHDLRNPLSVILVSSRMLLRSLGPDAPGRRQLDAIVRAADEINQLAQDLIDAASIERGSLRVGHDAQEIAPIVDRALDAVSYAAAARPLALERELPKELLQVVGDPERLIQTLAGLLTNAIRFTPKGGKITVRAERCGADARFSITDTGSGVPEEQRDQLFARFPAARRQLVGLGPFVAKGIVEAHGGAIWADSAPGQGTTVYFTIPAAAP